MEIIRGLPNLRERHHGCALTIGNFDGVHRGHQAVIAQLAELAGRLDVPSVLMTFEPHPREFFSAPHAPARLTRFREKMIELRRSGAGTVLLVRFDERFSSQSPSAFIEDLLVRRLGARCVLVGDDFRFGHRAEGTVETLREHGERAGFETHRHATFPHRGKRVSSSWVRDALAQGDLGLARDLLGREYTILGRVVRGEQLGRRLGFPTANVALGRVATALGGVFAARVHGLGPEPLPGMANVGSRPTVAGVRTLLEVHLFDFDRDVYGREVRVEFVARLRDERKFPDLDALARQLAQDAVAARTVLAEPRSA